MWRAVYETESFQADLETLLVDLQPLYRLLHAYVRKQLKKTYGTENFPRSGHIPAHLLGNITNEPSQSTMVTFDIYMIKSILSYSNFTSI